MERKQFIKKARAALPALLHKYGLTEWKVRLDVEKFQPEDALPQIESDFRCHRYLHKSHDGYVVMARVDISEEYRRADLAFDRESVESSNWRVLRDILEHEVQHIAMHPFNAFLSFVASMCSPDILPLLLSEAQRTQERLRSAIGHLTRKGDIHYR